MTFNTYVKEQNKLHSKQGCKILRDTNVFVSDKYDQFVNKLRSYGGFVHGSQSHVTPKIGTNLFEYTIFIYYEVPKEVDMSKL